MAATPEMDALVDLMHNSYAALRSAFEPFSDDQLDFAPQGGGFTVRQQVMHSCSADLTYLNRIDGGNRPMPKERVGENPDKTGLLRLLDETQAEVLETMEKMPADVVCRNVDIPWAGAKPALWVMMHVLRHIHYHTGQLRTYQYCLGVGTS